MTTFSLLSAIPHPTKTELITVEADVHPGFHTFSIVGLGDKSLKEARERVTSAIKNSGLKPKHFHTKKLTVLLAPGHKKKEGTYFDLSIALSVLGAHGIYTKNHEWLCIGELSLDGKIKKCEKIIPILSHIIKNKPLLKVIIPYANRKSLEILDISNFENVFCAKTLKDALNIITGRVDLSHDSDKKEDEKVGETETSYVQKEEIETVPNIIGNTQAKRALLIAQTGNHHICLYGPSGTGKTSLSKWAQMSTLKLNQEQKIEVLHNYAFLEQDKDLENIEKQPFVVINHEIPKNKLLGGGSYLVGEIGRAHNGILFMDEFIEYSPQIIRSLRSILETGKNIVYSNNKSYTINANFLLITATNLCPCGNFGSKTMSCSCKEDIRYKYTNKIPGAIIDRIPLWALVENEQNYKSTDKVTKGTENELENIDFDQYKKMLNRSIQFRNTRIARENNTKNTKKIEVEGDSGGGGGEEEGIISKFALDLKKNSSIKMSHRSFKNLLLVARTIADIEQCTNIKIEHIYEALSFRPTIFNK